MLTNYFKIAVRNILRNKIHSLISIAGLGIGIACCVVIALYVINEESYDRFNKKADRIVRVTTVYSIGGKKNEVAVTGTKVLPAFEQDFPEVESGVRLYRTRAVVKCRNRVFSEPRFAFADSTFFKMFSFNLMQGDPVRVLATPYSVVLTKSAASKYFGGENPIGKIVRVNMRTRLSTGWEDYTVTGVMQDCPSNSQIKFDFLGSFCSLPVSKPGSEKWLEADYFTYLLLRTPQSAETLQKKIPVYMKARYNELGITGKNYLTFHLQPLEQVHLHSTAMGDLEPQGNYRYVIMFSLVALLILGVASANYVNLTTAKFSDRAREVGVRKVAGASRTELTYQFMGESLILVLFALVLALMIVELLLPAFDSLSGMRLRFSPSQSTEVAATIAAITLLVAFLGGAYPAVVLSRFRPVQTLKGDFTSGSSGLRVRKILIVTQFVVSIGLIVSALIIHGQMKYILTKDLGFDKDHVVVLPVDKSMAGKTGALKSEFLRNSGITGVTFATRTPVFINSKNYFVYDKRKIVVNQLGVDGDFLKTLGVQLVAGNGFSRADTFGYAPGGPAGDTPVILNETALKQFDLKSEEAIGKKVVLGGRECRIKGVIRDFHFTSMHDLIGPLVLFPNGYFKEMMVKLSGAGLPKTLNYMKGKWNALVPDHPFDFRFLDDDFNSLYVSETRTERLFSAFAVMTVALACLGLFGLVAFSVRQRAKEVGIRKVLGAKVWEIVLLLSREYMEYILLANLFAWPIAYFALSRWLQGFAYRIGMSWWIFAAAGGFALLVALGTLSVLAIRAATANPVRSLRYE